MVRKIVAVSALVALSLALTATLAAARIATDFGGRIEKDPNTFIGFDMSGSGKHKQVTGLFVDQVNVACDNDAFSGRQGTLQLSKSLKVNSKGAFKGSNTQNLPVRAFGVPTKYKVSVKGKIKRKKAKGTVVVGLLGNNAHCYSGTLRWKATDPPPNV